MWVKNEDMNELTNIWMRRCKTTKGREFTWTPDLWRIFEDGESVSHWWFDQ